MLSDEVARLGSDVIVVMMEDGSCITIIVLLALLAITSLLVRG